MSEWLPIKIAPKDRVILVTDGEAVQESYWQRPDGPWVCTARQSKLWASPTHWQHLPEPPK